jgi:hypothetical protein
MQTRWITLAAAATIALTQAGSAVAQDSSSSVNGVPKSLFGPADQAPTLVIPAMPAAQVNAQSAPPAVPAAACQDRSAQPFTPVMFGDFMGPVVNVFSDFKIAEGESPRPMDRVFFRYNYYNNLSPDRWKDPTLPVHNVNLDLYTFGMEKTFFDGAVSLGMRIPFHTLDAEGKDFHLAPDPVTGVVGPVPGGPGIDQTNWGNIVAVAKAVLWEDRPAGDILSAGVVASVPTASNVQIDPGISALMYFQPFTGFILTSGDLYVQGFTSMTLPIARPEAFVSFSDIGVGYYVWRDTSGSRLLSAVAPTLEMHYTAPIRQPDPTASLFGNFSDAVRIHNTVDFTLGTTFEFSNRATLGLGLAIPVTGQRPFDMEGLVQLNMMF